MLAYQLIYTACGKDRNGSFSVWAKSNEITKIESDEITVLMAYRKPKNVPYNPTPEELKTLFPKKFGYFILSSGRKCIAQTTYVHNVYSDGDGRFGNYVIHAYVFDSLEEVCPFGIINTDIFKTELTYKEWHDDPIPESLPAVDIAVNPYISETEIKNYLSDSTKTKALGSLLQAVINSLNDNERVVSFNSTEEEQKVIYSLLGLLLPKSLHDKATFSNQYTSQVEFSLSSNGMIPTKIRNIFGIGASYGFNYEEEINAGRYAFYYDKSLFVEIPLNRYVEDILQTLKTKSLFETLKKVEQIDKIMKDLGCGVDEAVCAYNLINNNYAFFKQPSELESALNYLIKANYINPVIVAQNVYNHVICTKRWGFNNDIKNLIQFVYGYCDNSIKDAIVYEVFNDLESFGVSTNQAYSTIIDDLKAKLPFDFQDVYQAVIRNQNIFGIFENSSSSTLLYLYFDIACTILQGQPSQEVSQIMQQAILSIYKRACFDRDLTKITFYLDKLKVFLNNIEYVVYTAEPTLFESEISNKEDLEFAFKLALMLSSFESKLKFIYCIVKNNLTSPFFMDVYVAFSNNNSELFNQIEEKMKDDAEAKAFFIQKDAYVFKNTSPVTNKALDDYFKKYYSQGYDNGIYLIKLQEYFASISNDKAKLNELLTQYTLLSKFDNSFADVVKIILYIEKEIYSIDMKELVEVNDSQYEKLKIINKCLVNLGINTSKKFEILTMMLLTQKKFGKDALYLAIDSGRVYDNLSLEQLDSIANNQLDFIIKVYCEVKESNRVNIDRALESLIYPLIASAQDAKLYLEKALENVNREYYDFLADVMAYGFNKENQFAVLLKDFVKWYVDRLSRADYKKLFKKVKPLISEKDAKAVNEYMDEYLDEHMSFFDLLFGKKKDKEEKKDKKAKKGEEYEEEIEEDTKEN